MGKNKSKEAYEAKKALKKAKREAESVSAHEDSIKKNKSGFRWLVYGVIALMVILFVTNTGGDGEGETLTREELKFPQSTDRHLKANVAGLISLVEYSDFECPACRVYHSVVGDVLSEYGDDITFSYRHFPLTSIHEHADLAARATEAAALQGKFWDMHDLLFINQTEWSRLSKSAVIDTYEQFAYDLDLDVAQYRIDIESDEVREFVDGDIRSGRLLRITGTPTFFLDGEKMNVRNGEEFTSAIVSAIMDARGAQGTEQAAASDDVTAAMGGTGDGEVASTTDDPYLQYIDLGDDTEVSTTTEFEGIAYDGISERFVYVNSYYFTPSKIKVPVGSLVRITLESREGFHNFSIDKFGVKSASIGAGNQTVFEFVATELGEYPIYSSVGNDKPLGLDGLLIVQPR